MTRAYLLLAMLFSFPFSLHAQSLRDAIQRAAPPAITPWKKPVYPESKENFIEGFKQAGYQLVCGVKEVRDCMGFTNQCLQEVSIYTDACVNEGNVAIPSSFASINGQREVNGQLLKCVGDKQRESGAGVMSIDACNKVDEMRKRASGTSNTQPGAPAQPH